MPFVDGRASYHKAACFPVAGMFVDHVLSNFLLDNDSVKKDAQLFGRSLYFNYAMGRLKETVLKRAPNQKSVSIMTEYKLPDGRKLVSSLNV